MNDALEKQITGEPVTVTICGTPRRLEYRFAAIIAYQEKTGDSLFDRSAYGRIDLAKDPKRWLACLWAGLHEPQPDKSWKAPFTFEELTGLVDLSPENAAEISIAMVRALRSYFPKAKDEPVPKDAAPGELAPNQTPTSPTSPSSTRAPGADSALAGSSS
jgi:hypothetical protein